MRTTITLDEDVAAALERKAEENRVSFKTIVNTTLRRGLSASELAGPAARVILKPFGGGLLPGIDPNRMNQLHDELETEAFLEKSGKSQA